MGTEDQAPQDSATPEQPLTLDQVQGLLQQFSQSITQQINGLAAKTKRDIETVKSESDDKFQKLIGSLTPSSPTEETTDTPPAATPPTDDPIAKLKADMERRVRDQAKKLQEMESKMLESENRAQRLQAVQDFTRIAGDRIIDPDALLTIAESRGLLQQNGTQFTVVAGKDEYTGEPIVKPVNEALDALIAVAPYMEKPRPGNGTGATAGDTPPPAATKYDDPAKIMAAIMEGKASEVIREIKG